MTLRINIYVRNQSVRAGGGISPHLLDARDGFRRHGIEPTLIGPDKPQPCDLAVLWGFKKDACVKSGRRALIMERGYVGDRMKVWTSIGYDGLNGKADFCNADMPPERWEQNFAHLMKPWRDGRAAGYVLVMGQVAGDASIRGVDIGHWYRETCKKISLAGHRVAFRPHPLYRRHLGLPHLAVVLKGTIEEALRGAKFVVTYNSNSGVDAVLAGVPTVTCDRGSMAYAVTGHDPAKVPPTPDRSAWAAAIAYAQWKQDEIRNGDFWAHLKIGMEQSAEVAA
jgi:hypothetical protein